MNRNDPSDLDASIVTGDARWYRPAYEGKRHEPIAKIIDRLWQAQKDRREEMLKHLRLYGNAPFIGLGPRNYSRKKGVTGKSRLAFNVVRSCCDTYTAKLSREKPKVSFVTSGGDWEIQERAKQLDTFVEGQFYESSLYDLAPLLVLDSAVWGNGVAKFFVQPRRKAIDSIKVERVLPWEILVDDEESFYGETRTIFHVRYVDRLVLMEKFPEHRAEIASETLANNDHTEEWGYEPLADQLRVIEAWHLPSGPDANDGRFVTCLQSVTLQDVPYEKEYLPFLVLRRQKPPVGWWGTGIADELEGLQFEINVLLNKIQRSHHLLAAGHWIVQKGSTNKARLDNELGSIFEYSGTPPQLVTGMAVHPEVYQHLERLYQKSYELVGISPQAAMSQKPADISSGKALQVLSDIQTERFQVNFREYQHFFLNAARIYLDLAADIADADPDYSVKAASRNLMQRIRWDDVKLDEDEYVLKLYPTNALAQEPAERMAQVQQFANAGWIDPNDAKRLLDFPDLEAFSNLENASYNLVMSIIAKFNQGEYVGPEPMMDLGNATKWVQLSYLKAKMDGVPEKNLDLYRRWLVDAQDILHPPQPPAPPMPPGPPGPPGAGPDMPPPPPMGAEPPTGAPPGMGAPPVPPPPGMPGGPQGQ